MRYRSRITNKDSSQRINTLPGNRLFLPELHDIHPGSYRSTASILSFLSPGVRDALSLLIVPCWGGKEPVDEGTPILRLIHPLPGERILHGYSHCRPNSIVNRLWFGTDHHGEFDGLEASDATTRIMLGLSAFERAGLPRPRFFCAPRWIQSKATADVLFELGFTGFMDRRGYRTRDGVRRAIPAVFFDTGRRRWNTLCHFLATRLYLNFLMATERPFRLALHPTDAEDKRVKRFLARLFRRLEREGWRAAHIGEVINP